LVKVKDGKISFDFPKDGNLPTKRDKGKEPALAK